MTAAVPVLTTARLRLRPHRMEDFAACRALWQDAWTVRFIGGHVQDDQAVWFRLLRYAGFWALLGFGFWAVEDKATGAYLGDAGLMDARRGIAGLEGAPEAGWAFVPEAAGRGIATEAMAAILAWADAHLDAACTRCIIAPGNAASLRVAAKLGYRQIGQEEQGDDPILLLERRRGEPGFP